jgi:hypothetical protein
LFLPVAHVIRGAIETTPPRYDYCSRLSVSRGDLAPFVRLLKSRIADQAASSIAFA